MMGCKGCGGKRNDRMYFVKAFDCNNEIRFTTRVVALAPAEAVQKARKANGKIVGGYYLVRQSSSKTELRFPEIDL